MVVKCFNRVSALKFLTEENPNFTLVHYNWTVGGDFYSLFLCITTEGPLCLFEFIASILSLICNGQSEC